MSEYEVTLRDYRGNKIVSRFEVNDPCMTIQDIVNAVEGRERIQSRIQRYRDTYQGASLRYFFFTDLIPLPPPPPPKPEPMDYLWAEVD